MTVAVPEAEELAEAVYGGDPRCQFVYVCDKHDEEPCQGRARWVATIRCDHDDPGPNEQLLGCDECHDDIEANGNRVNVNHVVEWRSL